MAQGQNDKTIISKTKISRRTLLRQKHELWRKFATDNDRQLMYKWGNCAKIGDNSAND
jgi:hypothetical protein